MNRYVVAAGVLLASLAFAQVPDRLGYSGRLLRANGTPETGTVSLTFSLYDSASGGSQLWTEQQMVMLTSDGLYATTLGASTAIPGTVFDGSTAGSRYLEVSVNGTPLVPRQLINSVPWALTAKNVKGGTVDATGIRVNSQDLLVNGRLSPSFGYQAGNGVTIDSNNVISLPSCTAGQVLVWNASNQWACGSATGPAGQSVTTMTEPAGMNCANGGVRLTSVSGTSYVCNGAAGMQGTPGLQGTPGAAGAPGQSVTVATEAPGANCATGGLRLTSSSGTNYVCNGATGASGGGGGNGRNLFRFDSSLAQWATTSSGMPMTLTANTTEVAEGDSSFDFAYGNVASSTGIVGVWGSDFIPVDPTRVYEGRIKVKSVSGTFLGTFSAGLLAFDKDRSPLQGPSTGGNTNFVSGTTRCVPFIVSQLAGSGLNGTTWTEFSGRIVGEGSAANTFPNNTRYIKPCVGTNLGGIGTTRIDSFEIFEKDTNPLGSVVRSFTTAGTYTFVVPSGVMRVHAQAVGGGGGGANGVGITYVTNCVYSCPYLCGVTCSTSTSYTCGAGGSAGGHAADFLTVIPGQTLTIVVGSAGAAAGAGGQSRVNDGASDVLVANGGAGSGGAGGTGLVRGSATPATGIAVPGKQGGGGTGATTTVGSAGSGGNANCASAGAGQAGQPGAVILTF